MEHPLSTKHPHATDKHVGNRVRMRRLMLSMSQGKLADQLGLTFQQVQKYEKGTNRISASRLQQLSDILDVPISFFFEQAPEAAGHGRGHSNSTPTAYVDGFLATSDGLALVKAFMEVDDPVLRRSIVRVVEGIAARGRP
jgi:transcriptional regulator with XRE-family HTH domain